MNAPTETPIAAAYYSKWERALKTVVTELISAETSNRLYSLSGAKHSDVIRFFDRLETQLAAEKTVCVIPLPVPSRAGFDVIARTMGLRLIKAVQEMLPSRVDWSRMEHQLLDSAWGPRSEMVVQSTLEKCRDNDVPRLVCIVRTDGRLDSGEMRAVALVCERVRSNTDARVVFASEDRNSLFPGEPTIQIELPRHSPKESIDAISTALQSVCRRRSGETGPLPFIASQEKLPRWASLLTALTFPNPSTARDWLVEFRLVVEQILSDRGNKLDYRSRKYAESASRLLFLFLLRKSEAFGAVVGQVRSRTDGEDALFQLQQAFLGDVPDPGMLIQPEWKSRPPWNEFAEHKELRSFFLRAMGGDDPLVPPFGSRQTLSLFLWSDPASVFSNRSAAASQSLDLWTVLKRWFAAPPPIGSLRSEVQELVDEVLAEGDLQICLDTANQLLNTIDLDLEKGVSVDAKLDAIRSLIGHLDRFTGDGDQWIVKIETQICAMRLLGVQASQTADSVGRANFQTRAVDRMKTLLDAMQLTYDKDGVARMLESDVDRYRALGLRALVAQAYYLDAFASSSDLRSAMWQRVVEVANKGRAEEAFYVGQLQLLASKWPANKREIKALARTLVQSLRDPFSEIEGEDVGVFVSYRSKDIGLVKAFVEGLTLNPAFKTTSLTFWIDYQDVSRGEDWNAAVMLALLRARYFLVFESHRIKGPRCARRSSCSPTCEPDLQMRDCCM